MPASAGCGSPPAARAWGKRNPSALPLPPALSDVGLVICHVTEQCNLRCRYCSASAPAYGTTPQVMPLDTVRAAAATLFRATRRRSVAWIFFGGEPLLSPMSWYRRAYPEIQRAAAEHGIELRFGMQTNATLVTEEVADFLREVGLRPSVSLDGPPAIHNLMREGAEQTLAGIARLAERGLEPTILVVLGPHNIERVDELVDFFVRRGLKRVKFNIYQCAGRAGAWGQIDPHRLAQARLRLLDLTLAGQILDVNVARLMHLVARGRRSRPDDYRGCGAPHCGAGIRHVAVGPDGRLFPCDRCQAAELGELGSVHEPVCERELGRRIADFHGRRELPRDCRDCPAQPLCHSCCTAYRDSRQDVDVLCAASRLLWAAVRQRRAHIGAWVRQHPLSEFGSGRPSPACGQAGASPQATGQRWDTAKQDRGEIP
jgi:uncharacterized protein